jgi:hypothetical protein
MQPYKNHPVYGIGVSQPGKLWHPKGLIFSADPNGTSMIKRLEHFDLSFKTEKEAEAHALKLCRAWIDAQPGEPERGKSVPERSSTELT